MSRLSDLGTCPGYGVVITGIGLHTGFGNAAETVDAMVAGRSSVGAFQLPGADGFPPVAASSAAPYSLDPYVNDPKIRDCTSMAAELSLIGAARALRDASLLDDAERRGRLAMYMTTGHSPLDVVELRSAIQAATRRDGTFDVQAWGTAVVGHVDSRLPRRMLLNTPMALISRAFGIRGDNAVLFAGPEQGGVCLDMAVRGIRAGRFSRAMVGSGSHVLSLIPLVSMMRLGMLAQSPEQAIPHRLEHKGCAPADVAAFLIMESEESAHARGAHVYASVDAVAMGKVALGSVKDKRSLQEDLWRELSCQPRPDWLVTTGSMDAMGDRSEIEVARRLWPATPPRMLSFDGALGWGAGAAVFLTTAMTALLSSKGRAPETCTVVERGPALHNPDYVLVSCTEPDGGCVAIALAPYPESEVA